MLETENLDKILWSSWEVGGALKFNISKNSYDQPIGENTIKYKKKYTINLRKIDSRKLELFYPAGILNCFEYFNFLSETDTTSVNNIIRSVYIEVNDKEEIVRISNIEEINQKLEIAHKILLKKTDVNLEEVKSKFSYLFQNKSSLGNIVWKDVDLLLEDYLVKFQNDSYINFNDLNEKSNLKIDLCQNYIDHFEDYIVEYFEGSDNLMERKNDFEKMESLFLANELEIEKLKHISLKHRKYVYDKSNFSLKSALLYQKVDSDGIKKLDLVRIEIV